MISGERRCRLRQTRIGARGSQRSLVRITKADIGSEASQFISQLSEALKKRRRTKFREGRCGITK
jgi:hypothetical protein